MRGFRGLTGGRFGFVAGFAAASVLFGGLALASDFVQRQIPASFLPLKYVFNGTEKLPPADQQGFTYNERTYVPLRFMAESLGQKVEWDGDTYTIYIGRKPSPLPAEWNAFASEGRGIPRVEHFLSGVTTVMGKEMADTLLFSAFASAPAEGANPKEATTISTNLAVEPGARSLAGALFVPAELSAAVRKGADVGKITLYDDHNQVLYDSTVLTYPASAPVDFNVSLNGTRNVRVVLTLYHNQGRVMANNMVTTEIGLSLLHFKH